MEIGQQNRNIESQCFHLMQAASQKQFNDQNQ